MEPLWAKTGASSRIFVTGSQRAVRRQADDTASSRLFSAKVDCCAKVSPLAIVIARAQSRLSSAECVAALFQRKAASGCRAMERTNPGRISRHDSSAAHRRGAQRTGTVKIEVPLSGPNGDPFSILHRRKGHDLFAGAFAAILFGSLHSERLAQCSRIRRHYCPRLRRSAFSRGNALAGSSASPGFSHTRRSR